MRFTLSNGEDTTVDYNRSRCPVPATVLATLIHLAALTRLRFIASLAVMAMLAPIDTAKAGQRHSRILALPCPGRVVIDGSLDEWDQTGAVDSAYEESLAPRFTMRLAVMYDREALYLGAHVVDDSPMLNRHDPQIDPRNGWAGDALQVRLTVDPKMPYPGHGLVVRGESG